MKWNSTLYNTDHAFVYKYGEDVLALLNAQPNERILDLGCGSGQLTSKISEVAKEVIGIDKSPEMIADAKTRFSNIEFQVADAASFSFKKPFDAVFSNATLHWVTDYKQAAKAIYNNLKPNGRLVAEFGGKGNVQTIVNELRKALSQFGYQQQAELKQWYFPSIAEYATVLEQQGFKVDIAYHFNRPTELANTEDGIKQWISMFATNFFKGISENDINIIKQQVQNNIKDTCFTNGKWYADYKRIRIVATKQ